MNLSSFSAGGGGNPWVDDERVFGSVRNVITLTERTGHLDKVHMVLMMIDFGREQLLGHNF